MTTPTNSDRLREIAERAEKATPGPWESTPLSPYQWHTIFAPKDSTLRGRVLGEVKPDFNADFIAAAREDIPFLLSEINKLNAEKAEIEERDQRWVDNVCHYRNLAIMLGAKPEQMTSKYDADLARRGISDDVEPLGGIEEVWEDLERLEAEKAELVGALEWAAALLHDLGRPEFRSIWTFLDKLKPPPDKVYSRDNPPPLATPEEIAKLWPPPDQTKEGS